MSFPASIAIALCALLGLFALLFVLAGVEGRMFEQVMEDPQEELALDVVAEEAPALGHAA